MQTVPSLVGTGTAVAAATAGLVFGQPTDPPARSERPTSPKRKSTANHDTPRTLPTLSRPGTGSEPLPSAVDDTPAYGPYHTISPSFGHYPPSASRSYRLAAVFNTPQRPRSRRQSILKGDTAVSPVPDDRRDSFSSNGSWMRRLSLRPLSQHGSEKSSIGPDSPLFAMPNTNGSVPPVSSPTGPIATPPPHQRNKLVKRQPEPYSTSTVGRRGIRPQLPSIRRPATSHQRSATAQQFQARFDPPGSDKTFSFEICREAEEPNRLTGQCALEDSQQSTVWRSFFHTKTARIVFKGGSPRPSPRSSEAHSNSALPSGSRRLITRVGDRGEVYLVRPCLVNTSPMAPNEKHFNDMEITFEPSPAAPGQIEDKFSQAVEDTPSKPPRKSISMHFTSPTSWIPRTGSIRRPKRGDTSVKEGGKRYVSAPAAGPKDSTVEGKGALEAIYGDLRSPSSNGNLDGQFSATDPSAAPINGNRQRNTSSPLPPLSRLSSFHIDLSRVGLSSSHGRQTPTSLSPSSPHAPIGSRSQSRNTERGSTIGRPELDGKDGPSGDDDTDFRSDTMFDSIRTIASVRRRTAETPLESMFDETPPSTASNARVKRLSVQEMLVRSFEADDGKITEEDESISTPIRTARSSTQRLALVTGTRLADETARAGASNAPVLLNPSDFDRPSFDDDEDWAREYDDDGFANHLSPPSNLVNSRSVSPSFRTALATISGNVSGDLHSETATERPRSSVFDWSESSVNGKEDNDGHSSRPRTVHGKQELDARGGRAPSRRPAGLHIRSQSVPVVPDQPENSKSTPKFGTWATGKPASEDWDEDFDFGEEGGNDEHPTDKRADSGFAMVIPSSIQASQRTIKAHSGQIREFSMLVNKLKDDIRQAQSDGLLNTHSALWKEAQGIIALASPDDDSTDESVPASPSSSQFESSGDESTSRKLTRKTFMPAQRSTPTRAATTSPGRPSAMKPRRRQSVFSPDDDIFGTWLTTDDEETSEPEPPKTPTRHSEDARHHDSVARSVMEAVHLQQLRSASDPTPSSNSKVEHQARLNFDTNSLRELVKRASELHARLADLVRRENGIHLTPISTPRHQRGASPAFIEVFENPSPASCPPARRSPPPLARGNGASAAALGRGGSMDASPSAAAGIGRRRMPVMTVN